MAMAALFSVSPPNLRLLASPSPGTGDRRSARLSLSPPVQPVKTTKAVIFGGRTNLLAPWSPVKLKEQPVKASTDEDAEPDSFDGASELEFQTSPMYFDFVAPECDPALLFESLTQLRRGGIRGILIDIKWGIVESEPKCYRWEDYLSVMQCAQKIGLKVRAVLVFHEDVPRLKYELPIWVQEEMNVNEDLCFRDKAGTKYKEYISFGADEVVTIRGRTPVEIYNDFIQSFAQTFKEYLSSGVVQDIQMGLGPEGELKYPSGYSIKGFNVKVSTDFKCHDKYMLSDFQKFAKDNGVPEWGLIIPDGEMVRACAGESEKCAFFLEWYTCKLLSHAEAILSQARLLLPDIPIFTMVALDYEVLSRFYPRAVIIFDRYGIDVCCSFDAHWMDDEIIDQRIGRWMGEMGERREAIAVTTGVTIGAMELSRAWHFWDITLPSKLARVHKILRLYNSMYPLRRRSGLSINVRSPYREWLQVGLLRNFLRSYYAEIMG